jgi:hypothetical protein
MSTFRNTKANVTSKMNKRLFAPEALVGKTVSVTIEGNGVKYDVKNKAGEFVESVLGGGAIFQKMIYNLEANSEIALNNPANKALKSAARAAETAGNTDEAHELYQQFLRKVQMDFSVPTTSPIVSKLGHKCDISAKLMKITTENGSILTIDPATIRILEPVALGSTTFSFDDEDETVATPASEVAALSLK